MADRWIEGSMIEFISIDARTDAGGTTGGTGRRADAGCSVHHTVQR
jgi:hypothetical protein